MVKNHACHTFEPKYLLDYKILKYLMKAHSCSYHQMVEDRKTNINDVAEQNLSKMFGIHFWAQSNQTLKLEV